MGYGSVVVGSATSALILTANSKRYSIIITNNGNSAIHLGQDSSVTTNTGIFMDSGANLTEDSGGDKVYQGAYYAISEDSTNRVAYWERER